MTGLNHALTGAAVATVIDKPALALPAALLSHFAADMVPHWDYRVRGGVNGRLRIMAVDLTLSIALLLVLAATVDAVSWVVIAGGLLGILPDTMWLRFFMTGKYSIHGDRKSFINRLREFHLWIQWSETGSGIYVEAVWLILVLILVFQVHHRL